MVDDQKPMYSPHMGAHSMMPDEIVDRVTHEGKQLLDNLPYQQAWGFTPPIPMPWDCKHGKGWGSMRKLED